MRAGEGAVRDVGKKIQEPEHTRNGADVVAEQNVAGCAAEAGFPALLAAVQEAAAMPDEALPRMPHVPRPVVSDATRRRIDALKKWRTDEGARLGLDVSVVLPQRLLEQVAEKPPARAQDLLRIEGFRRWRVATFGDALVAAAVAPPPIPGI